MMKRRLKPVSSSRVLPPVDRYIFSDEVIRILEQWFGSAGAFGIEDVAIAAGHPTADGDAVVVSVLHPDADRAPGWYEQRNGATWDQLYRFGFDYGLYYLCQLHTHPPGYGTRHSPTDDVGAFSDRLGFLSIVLPDFGLCGIHLHDPTVSVHERTSEGWRVWPHDEVQRRLAIVPFALDLQQDSATRR